MKMEGRFLVRKEKRIQGSSDQGTLVRYVKCDAVKTYASHTPTMHILLILFLYEIGEYSIFFSDGKPDAVKVARPVWVGGKLLVSYLST